MENRSRLIVFVLLAVLAVGGGFVIGALVTGGNGSGTETPSDIAEATPGEIETEEPTDEVTEEPTEEPSEAPSESAPAASPTAAPALPATITITNLFVDAADNPDGADRIITFTSATGSVKAEISSVTPMGDLEMCLKTPTKTLGCRTAGEGTLTAKTTKAKETFIVTLRGQGIDQPIVDVKLTFLAKKPTVSIENARFDGTSYPDTNGIQALITPRVSGSVGIKADWGGHPFLYEIDLMEQGGDGTITYAPDMGNVATDLDFAITAPNPWKLVLQNTETGFGVTPMNAVITWP